MSTPILIHIDLAKVFILEVCASYIALASVFSQSEDNK